MDDHTVRIGARVVIDAPIDTALDALEHLAGKRGTVTAITERDGQLIVSVRLANGHYVDVPERCVVPV